MEANKKRIRVLKRIFGEYAYSSKERLFHCPKCKHHKKKLSINLKKNVFKCWICDYSGRNIDRLVRRWGDITDQREWLSYRPRVEISEFDKILLNITEEEQEKIDLPAEFISLTRKSRDIEMLKARRYLNSRGIGYKDILKWKIGYCKTGEYKGRVVFPSFDEEGEVNYFVSRTYNNSWRTYKNPSCSKNKIIFNELYLDFNSDLVITEGVFDAIKAGPNAVPIMGSTISQKSKLFWEIVRNDTPVYICLDKDAKEKELKIIEELLKYDVEIYRISLGAYKDLGEMEKKTFKEKKEKAILMTQESCMIERVNLL